MGVPSSPPPTACLRSVEERVRPPALGAEGSWRRLCGGRNARIAAAHPHCASHSRLQSTRTRTAASPHRTFTGGDCFQDRQPKARDERSGQGRRKALALALTASEAALTLPLLEQSPTPSGTKNNPSGTAATSFYIMWPLSSTTGLSIFKPVSSRTNEVCSVSATKMAVFVANPGLQAGVSYVLGQKRSRPV